MARTKGRGTWRTKEWYDVLAPSMFGSTKIGETLASDPEKVIGRVIETTLGDLVEDFSKSHKSHIKIFFKVKEVEGNDAKTKFVGHDMSREYLRSQVRRGSSKIDCITTVNTSDGRKIRITAMAVTLNRAQSPQKTSIQKSMEEFIQEEASKYEFTQLAQQMILEKFASDIYQNIKKICPIRRVEVRKSKVVDGED